MNFKPFENDSSSITIAKQLDSSNGITLENGTEEIIVYGDLVINPNDEDYLKVIDTLINIFSNIGKQLSTTDSNITNDEPISFSINKNPKIKDVKIEANLTISKNTSKKIIQSLIDSISDLLPTNTSTSSIKPKA